MPNRSGRLFRTPARLTVTTTSRWGRGTNKNYHLTHRPLSSLDCAPQFDNICPGCNQMSIRVEERFWVASRPARLPASNGWFFLQRNATQRRKWAASLTCRSEARTDIRFLRFAGSVNGKPKTQDLKTRQIYQCGYSLVTRGPHCPFM